MASGAGPGRGHWPKALSPVALLLRFPQSTWFLLPEEAHGHPCGSSSPADCQKPAPLFPFPPVCPSQKPGRWHLPRQLLSVAPIPQQDGKQGHMGDRIAGIHSVPQTNPLILEKSGGRLSSEDQGETGPPKHLQWPFAQQAWIGCCMLARHRCDSGTSLDGDRGLPSPSLKHDRRAPMALGQPSHGDRWISFPFHPDSVY